jgi:hypothetical protein
MAPANAAQISLDKQKSHPYTPAAKAEREIFIDQFNRALDCAVSAAYLPGRRIPNSEVALRHCLATGEKADEDCTRH